jgi:aspartate carbamoyltransferase catalytic subunit
MQFNSLLAITDLSRAQIDALLTAALERYLPRVKAGGFKDADLKGLGVLLLFYEASTRTRVSFEYAGKMLGADTINISAKGSAVEKGESLADTALTLAAMGFSITIIRHPGADSAALYAKYFPGGTLNAGAGRGQHPTQALLDCLSLKAVGKLEPGARLAIVGDIKHSRVMRSGLQLMLSYGVDITLVAPPTLLPDDCAALKPEHWVAGGAPGRITVETDLDRALPSLDAVMMLRMQRERMEGGLITNLDEYSKLYGLNERRLKLLPQDSVILHPGPVNRGVEVGAAVYADPRCLINEQVSCGVALRCALLAWCAGKLPQLGA